MSEGERDHHPHPSHHLHPSPDVLRVAVAGGGPVGLAFALVLEDLLGPRVDIRLMEHRWTLAGDRGVWKTAEQGNKRRHQVVTIQSRQYRKLPTEVQERLFTDGDFSEMWPQGPDTVDGLGPRNVRIAHVEDRLLEIANERAERSHRIHLEARPFDPEHAREELEGVHVLAICDGRHSSTFEHFADRFGPGDATPFSLDGEQVEDMILGLRVASDLPDATSTLLTVSQNRFLLNSLHGEGFLNMRLTDQEAQEAYGIDTDHGTFTSCVQSDPCLLERRDDSGFVCETHDAVFLPALTSHSPLWARVQEGLDLFGIRPENLTAVTGYRLSMTQRARFSAQLYPDTADAPGPYGFLLGDAANAIHFWPGRGLNSGLASAISLARCLASRPARHGIRDGDFLRHEATMAMLQYRHKNRAWRQMVSGDDAGDVRPIKERIAVGIVEGDLGRVDRAAELDEFTETVMHIRDGLSSRVPGMPDERTVRRHLRHLPASLVHTLLRSGTWDSEPVGGEEVDVDWLLPAEGSAGDEAEVSVATG